MFLQLYMPILHSTTYSISTNNNNTTTTTTTTNNGNNQQNHTPTTTVLTTTYPNTADPLPLSLQIPYPIPPYTYPLVKSFLLPSLSSARDVYQGVPHQATQRAECCVACLYVCGVG